ncbi:restriction endonuclease subunit S [Pseudomonas sp. A-1]|uniref:restriction endonuclease subunit S n=1 Tax=Pseudomonas sp. A-1 TaxID=1821274 RepID=UPI0015AD3A90|nr:restriction endonuclease subunit S [Pseudomonas sp. A-1]
MSHYKPYPAYKDSGVEWLGEVPEHWAVCKLSFRYSIELGKMLDEKKLTKTSLVPYLRNQDVQWGSINTQDLPEMDIHPEELERYTIRDGDLLVCEGGDVGRAAIWRGESAAFGYQKALHRLRHRSSGADTAEFFFFALLTAKCRGVFEESDSKATIAHLPAEKFRQYRFAFPPLSEQQAIATHLDRETARLDALVAKKTRFTELLREKRQALITHAVTKGLNPNVRMKDSGVEWLGQVPEHWETMSLARVTVARCDGPFGSAIKSENYTDSGVRVIRLQNIGIGEFKDGDQAFLSPEYRTEVIGHGHDVEPGDLLIAGLGDENNPLGRTCVAPSSLGDAIVKADCYRFRTDRSKALPAFLALQLSATARVECGFISTGSTRERLNLGLAASRVIALPPSTDEQSAIVERASMAAARLDALLSKTEHSIELLKERRAALITAAVTGQIDLREHH